MTRHSPPIDHPSRQASPRARPALAKEDLRAIYDDRAEHYGRMLWLENRVLGAERLRRQLLRDASGRVLDVACGTGENFGYLNALAVATAIDLSPGMLAMARQRAQRLGLNVDLRVMDAERLEFADGEFDNVVSALSTCTFSDPLAALAEMRRVCRPGGRILLLEHGRSNWGVVGRLQDRTAHWHFRAAGCRWNQEPVDLVQAAGLTLVSAQRGPLGIFYAIQASP